MHHPTHSANTSYNKQYIVKNKKIKSSQIPLLQYCDHSSQDSMFAVLQECIGRRHHWGEIFNLRILLPAYELDGLRRTAGSFMQPLKKLLK